jgi:signal transduction histidine kinase
MNSRNGRMFAGKYQALSITAIYLVVSGIWIYTSNFLLFTEFPNIAIPTAARLDVISDGCVVLATAVLLYLLVRRSLTTLQRSEQALMVQSERLKTLSHKLIQIQENERRAIAQELHDEIGQALTGLKLSLEMANRLSSEPARASMKGALSLVNDLISSIRKLSVNLRPVALDDLGLLPALLWHFERYSRQTGVQVDFKHQNLDGRRFEQGIETAGYRIIQEGLTNVARHARTNLVEVRVWFDQSKLQLHIEDRGIGFDARVPDLMTSSGLVGMHERASILGGSFTIDSQPGLGTRLMAELPCST